MNTIQTNSLMENREYHPLKFDFGIFSVYVMGLSLAVD